MMFERARLYDEGCLVELSKEFAVRLSRYLETSFRIRKNVCEDCQGVLLEEFLLDSREVLI